MSPIKRLKKAKDTAATVVAKSAAALAPTEPTVDVPSIPEGGVPKITDETITEHREEVLKGARKYIYPLAHSKRRIVAVTVGLVVVALAAFSVYCSLGLYKFYQYNAFLYRVTQLVPFPIAKIGGHYVAYENYLFELRQYVHYYQTQQQLDFSNSADKQQLLAFRKQALNQVVNQAYVKQLAQQNHITVTNQEVNQRMQLLRNQNRIGSSDKVFSDVLSNYYGWSINDFKRSLKEQILTEDVSAALDSSANQKAQATLSALHKKGADFSKEASAVSEDAYSKAHSGDYSSAISKSDPNIPPEVIQALYSLNKGQTSGVIVTSNSLEIVQLVNKSGDTVTAKHISFKLADISTYIKPLAAKEPPHYYVHF